jgi:hypothetical protein
LLKGIFRSQEHFSNQTAQGVPYGNRPNATILLGKRNEGASAEVVFKRSMEATIYCGTQKGSKTDP